MTISRIWRLPWHRALRSLMGWLAPGLALGVAAIPFVQAGPGAGQVHSAGERDWPQFRGPGRDGICRETGLRKSWPEGGPALLWKREGIGQGYSSPVVAGDTLYITGDVEDALVIFALNLDGSLRWKAVNGRSWRGPYPGARASCTFRAGRLYHMNAHGRVASFNAADGKERWAVDMLERFGAENIYWGLSECLLLVDGRLLVTPGGPQTLMAALDENGGDTVWQTGPLQFLRTEGAGGRTLEVPYKDCDHAGYASPILFEWGGRRLVAGCSARHLFLVDPGGAKLVWSHPVLPARWEVIGTMPVVWRDRLVFAAPDYGTRCFRIEPGSGPLVLRPVWEAATDNCHGGLVQVGDVLFGSGYRRSRDWVGIDLETGQVRYAHPDLVKGAVLFADERLYALSENGVVTLLKPGTDVFETMGRFELPRGDSGKSKLRDVWAHPVIHKGRLYLRHQDVLFCYDVASPEGR